MNAKSKWACIFSIQTLVSGSWAYLWTLTTPDEVDLRELSQRWRKLIWNGFTPCVRVFEKHPRGHGYHVHFVTSERIDVDELRPRAERVGFGRVHVKRIPARSARYVAKYLTKQRGEVGVRLWACVAFKGSKAANIVITDSRRDDVKLVMQHYPAPSTYNFSFKWQLAEERRRKLFWHAADHEDEPDYEPPFPALYRRWKNDPYCSIGKSREWWAVATTQGLGAAAQLVGKKTS